MKELNKDIEMLQSALGMLKDRLKGKNGKIDLLDLRSDSRYIRHRSECLRDTIQDMIQEIAHEKGWL